MNNVPPKDIKLVAAYARVSTSNQEEQKTIDAQLTEVRRFACEKGYTIVKEYLDEGWSGTILARPHLDQLRTDAKRRLWDAVLIYDPDRLARVYWMQAMIINELKESGVETLFVTVPPPKNDVDGLMHLILGGFAEYERGKITERFRIGKLNRVANNHVLTTEAPYGYTYIPNKGKRGSADYVAGHYEVNEREASIVRNIFSWVADEGMTIRGVVRQLQKLGVPPRKSKRGVWATGTLSTLLRSEVYIGRAHWGASYAVVPDRPLKDEQYKKNKKTSRRMRPRDAWFFVTVPAIVERDVFDRAGQRLRTNFEVLGRNVKNNYLLAKKIWCHCGARRAGEGPQRGKHLYYRCTDRVHTFPLPNTCNEGGINARIADEAVWQRIKSMLSSATLLNELVERRKMRDASIVPHSSIDIEATKREIDVLKKQEDRYSRAYAEEVIPLEKLKEYLTPLRDKIKGLENQLIRAYSEMKANHTEALPTPEDIQRFSYECPRLLEDLNFTERKAIVSGIISKVTATQKDMHVYGGFSLPEIYVKLLSENRNCWVAECGEKHSV